METVKINKKQLQEILDFAYKGIDAEIDEKEKALRKGIQLLTKIENGEKVNTPKTAEEIQEINNKLNREIEALSRKKFDLHWIFDCEE